MMLDQDAENMTTAINSGDKLLALSEISGENMGPFVEEDLCNGDTRTTGLSSLQIRQENQGRNGKSMTFLSNNISKTNLEPSVEEENESNAMIDEDQHCHFVRSISVPKAVERDDISAITTDVWLIQYIR
mmetsp:Transcript_10761/g.14444  ORF Transcript_10761/g.14444 Transcript_10761/m.14444 type:complete len:130 (+) Transcript_10761:1-390(+)